MAGRLDGKVAVITGGGSGIGLAIVKALTEAHGGHVSVTSRGPGHGTTFTATVPASATSAPRGEGQPAGVPTSS